MISPFLLLFWYRYYSENGLKLTIHEFSLKKCMLFPVSLWMIGFGLLYFFSFFGNVSTHSFEEVRWIILR